MICFLSITKQSSWDLFNSFMRCKLQNFRVLALFGRRRILCRWAQIRRPRPGPGLTKRGVSILPRLCLFFLFCSVGLACAAATPQRLPLPLPVGKMAANFAIADFDGDQRADLATVQASGVTSSQSQYWIRFQLSTGERQSFGIAAPAGGLELSARDVNGDDVPDVIVSTSWLNRPVAILLNNGHGRFALVDPAEFPNVVWNSEDSGSLNAQSLHENGAVGLSPSSQNPCEAGDGLTLPMILPGALGQSFSPGPALPDDALRLVRGPPRIHHV